MKKARLFLVPALLAMVSMASGCAAMRAASARNSYVKNQTENLVISKPLDSVWPSVQQVIFAKGFQLKQSAAVAAYSLETEMQYNSSGNGSVGTRYLVQGTKVDDNNCKVTFTAFTERSGQTGTSRSSAR